MLCPSCSTGHKPGEPLRGILDVEMPRTNLGPDFSVFDFLPVEKRFFPKIPVGITPLWPALRARRTIGISKLFIKNDANNPTGSFKDRASYLVAAFARKHKLREIVLASTGNAGSSMAGIGAAAGLKVTLFLPAKAPRAKVVQALQYGARVIRVDGNYDAAYELSLAYTAKYGGFNRNTAFNPLTIEGKKTVSLEIFRQLGRMPDHVFVPVGDGVILSGVYKGFADLISVGLAQKMPTIHGIQAVGSNVISTAMSTGKFTQIHSNTIADSISVDMPRNGFHALENLKRYNGRCLEVTDEEILDAQRFLSRQSGLFTEPASAAAFAGLMRTSKLIGSGETVVVLATGSGLKDVDSALKGIRFPEKLVKTIDELRK
jgi:threonine synthase